ncbi:MAG TPA: hypothetical protein VKQ54_17205 [Caulobacteraceae bacterium]|nr:hypothetical protein [Caulobacteraceae bacterium]
MTLGEWAALSPGLARALGDAGATPAIEPRAHPAARIAALWRGGTPILTRGEVIWWPGAPEDLSAPGRERGMAVLQHELQHVLDFASGWLTAFRYLTCTRHWTYRWRLSEGSHWDAYGAEQRASIAEQLWLMERGLAPDHDLAAVRRLVPWV